MGERDTKHSSTDPVADVLLDFQSVMAQFLELQANVVGAFAARKQGTYAPPSVSVAPVEAAAPIVVPDPIVDTPQQHVEQLPQEVKEPQASEVAREETRFSRYTLAVRERPLGAARATLAPGRVVVLTEDGRGVAAMVAATLRSSGVRVAIISADGTKAWDKDVFVSPLDSPDESERVVRMIGETCGPVGALIHLAPLSVAPSFDALDAASWWKQLSGETRTLFLLARALGASLIDAANKGGSALIAFTSMGGSFGTSPDAPVVPSQGGVAGFTKCVAVEWKDVRVRAVDLDTTEPLEALAAHVIDELWAADASPEVGHMNGRRIGIDVVQAPALIDPSFDLPSDAVVLATGGARGITAEVCLELAERYQPTFVLVGQAPPPPLNEAPDVAPLTTPADIKRALMVRLQAASARVTPAMVEKAYRQILKEREIRETISKLSAAGARTHYVQLDVQDEQAFAGLIAEIYATYGRLDGVIHGAGIIEDKLVQDKSVDSFDRVFRTKSISAFVLSRHLRPETLRFVVFFSSVAGRFGNRGQADYAAANEVVSKLAGVLQRRWPVRVCSIAWAPWDKLGMVSPELKREFARRGVELLSLPAGRRALWQEIQQSPDAAAEVVVGGLAATPLTNVTRPEPLPLLKHATRETSASGAVRFERLLDPSIDLYLGDHRLDGRPVLPLAFATEFMAEAAQAVWPDLRVVAVRDLQLFKGIGVDSAPVPMIITVRGAVHGNDDGLTEVDVDIATPSMIPPLRYRSVVQMASRELNAPPFEPPVCPLVPLSASVENAYNQWTFHGPVFRRITDIAGIGADAIRGSIHSPTTAPVVEHVARTEWIIDPFVFDAALQLLLMWSRAQNNKTALPSRFRSFTRYAPLSDQPLTCSVEVESLADGHALKSNVYFLDEAGHVLAVLDTMEASCTNALNRLTGEAVRSTTTK
jgi:NAD(P)-dependent dehydrogenase (short-subunit alcohol dehydrogenase family)